KEHLGGWNLLRNPFCVPKPVLQGQNVTPSLRKTGNSLQGPLGVGRFGQKNDQVGRMFNIVRVHRGNPHDFAPVRSVKNQTMRLDGRHMGFVDVPKFNIATRKHKKRADH
ncbi:MAG: hypothetical protein AAFU56_10095, partial [Pseudomonadota bacterium]